MAKQVSFSLSVEGNPASAAVLNAIKQIEMEDHARMADMLRLRLAVAVKDDGSGWTLLDDALFTRLAHLKLSVTIGSAAATPLIDAYVIEVDTKFSNDPGGSELVVTAMDPTVLMHLDEKVKPWPNMKDSRSSPTPRTASRRSSTTRSGRARRTSTRRSSAAPTSSSCSSSPAGTASSASSR